MKCIVLGLKREDLKSVTFWTMVLKTRLYSVGCPRGVENFEWPRTYTLFRSRQIGGFFVLRNRL